MPSRTTKAKTTKPPIVEPVGIKIERVSLPHGLEAEIHVRVPPIQAPWAQQPHSPYQTYN